MSDGDRPAPERPALDLVVVHRRQAELAAETVRLFLAQGLEVRVAVVDNDSGTEQRRQLKATLPDEVTLLEQPANLGFGPGANAGLRWWLAQPDRESADWLAVCPHDARPWPDCVATALAELSCRPAAGLAAADVGDGLTPAVDRYFGAVPQPARVLAGWEPAGYPHGTLMFARRACLRDIGLFDERYFAYVEEADLALRARAANWQVGIVRGAEVRNAHLGSQLAVVDYLQQRNMLLLTREHFGRYALGVRTIMALWHLAAGMARGAGESRDPYWTARARVRALCDYARGRFGPPPVALADRH